MKAISAAGLFDKLFEDMLRANLEALSETNTLYSTDQIYNFGFSNMMNSMSDYVQMIIEIATGPIGMTLLVVCAFLSIYDLMTQDQRLRSDSKTLDNLALNILTFTALLLIIQSTRSLMVSIDQLSWAAADRIGDAVDTVNATKGYNVSALGVGIDTDRIVKVASNEGTLLLFSIIALIALIIALAGNFIGQVILVARTLEMLLYVCFAPIPLATLAHAQTRDIGKGFLVNYLAVAFRVAIIKFYNRIFPVLMLNVGLSVADPITKFEGLGPVLNAVILAVVYIMGIVGCGGISRRIFGRG